MNSFDTEYLVRPSLGSELPGFSVAKFEGRVSPKQIYTVQVVRGQLHCTCPGGIYRNNCKHITMVREFLKLLIKPWDPTEEDLLGVLEEVNKCKT